MSTSGPQMSSERPAAPGHGRGAGEVLDHVALVDRLGAVRRQRGIGSRRRRSTSRTSSRNEDDPAPTTIDARSAVEAGSARRAGSPRPPAARRRCCEMRRRRDHAAEVDDSLDARRPRPRARSSRPRPGRAPPKPPPFAGAGLHRVHEVVGGVDPVERLLEPRRRQQVAARRSRPRAAARRARGSGRARARAALRRQPLIGGRPRSRLLLSPAP